MRREHLFGEGMTALVASLALHMLPAALLLGWTMAAPPALLIVPVTLLQEEAIPAVAADASALMTDHTQPATLLEPASPAPAPPVHAAKATLKKSLFKKAELVQPQAEAAFTAEPLRTATSANNAPAEDTSAVPPQAAANNAAHAASDRQGADYAAQLLAWLARYKKYPVTARSRHLEGEALLLLRLTAEGGVAEARLARGTGAPMLDDAIFAMLRDAAPLPAPPPALTGRDLRLPVNFTLR